MKIIDSNGRLFGKLNIIDLALIIIIIMVAIAGYKFLNQNQDAVMNKPGHSLVQVEVISQPAYILDNIESGDIIYDNNEIIGVVQRKHIIKNTAVGSDMIIEIQMNVSTDKSAQLLINGEPITIGSGFKITTSKLRINSVIVGYDQFSIPLKTVQKSVKMISVNHEQWLLEALEVGNQVKNEKNKITAEIIEIDTTPSELLIADDATGYIKIITHPDKIDLILSLQLEILMFGDSMLYQGQELIIGKQLKLATDTAYIQGEIIEIKDI